MGSIKILIDCEENEEMLALYGGGRYVLSQEYKNWYSPIWHSWTSDSREGCINDFWAAAPTLEPAFVQLLNAG